MKRILISAAAIIGAALLAADAVASRIAFIADDPTIVRAAAGGSVGPELAIESLFDLDGPEPDRAMRRARIAEGAAGTYISDILLARDSSLARWPARRSPLSVWIQPSSAVADWSPDLVGEVRRAFEEWDTVGLPLRFAFAEDSAAADVHVTWTDRFAEPISGRTRWARDSDWWITDASIMLAVHHHSGPVLDLGAMRAMALHEVGHLLGLDHARDGATIMAQRVRVRSLSEADRATVALLYSLPAGAVR